MKRSDRLWA